MEENNELSATTKSVNTATNACHPAEAESANTATTPAKQPPTGHAKSKNKSNPVTFTNTKRHSGRVTIKNCGFCDEPYATTRPNQSSYCKKKCRRAAWLQRNPERAQQIAAADKDRLKAHLQARGVAWQEPAPAPDPM